MPRAVQHGPFSTVARQATEAGEDPMGASKQPSDEAHRGFPYSRGPCWT